MSLDISSAASLDSTTLAASDLLPVLDISASVGAKGSNITVTELARAILGFAAMTPIILSAKNVTVLTSGAPADIASITLPSWLTRWSIPLGSVGNFTSRIIAETASGTLAGASFTCYTAASGGGSAVTTAITGPSAAALGSVINGINPNSVAASFTSNTIYIRQTANSANAGTVSFYLMLLPFL